MDFMTIPEEQKDKIIRRSIEAQGFLASSLFVELREWIEREQKQAASAIAYNNKTESQKDMTRSEFVEALSGYYVSLNRIPDQLKVWANEQSQMKQYDEQQSTGQQPNQS